MNRTKLAAAIATALLFTGSAGAGTIDDEIAVIKARLKQLEQQVQAQNRVIQEKDRQLEALAEKPQRHKAASGGWFQRIELGGAVEVEAGYSDPDAGNGSSDIVVATAEVGIATQINDWVASEITLLYEEDEGSVDVDVATISIANPDRPWFISAGQQYLPFGSYQSNLVSDPLTLEIGETRETAVVAGLESDGFTGGIYAFNGDVDEGGDDEIGSFGLFAGYGRESNGSSFRVNAGYISNIGDSDGLQDSINDNLGGSDFNHQVPGVTLDALFATGPFTFIAEYTAATERFRMNELSFSGNGAQPSAFNIEAGYGFTLAGKEATAAIAYQETNEAVALGLAEKRIAAAISVNIMENTALAFEWAHDDDYSAADGGTGENGGDRLTAQLAVEF